MSLPTTDSATSYEDFLTHVPPHAPSALVIDLAAVQKNFQYLQSVIKGSLCGAVIKANAYGLGAVEIAPALAQVGCQNFFVAHIDEALEIHKHVPKAHIYILTGTLPETEDLIAHHKFIPILNDLGQIERWHKQAQHQALPAVIQFNTGMCRNGLDASGTDYLIAHPELLDGINVAYYMSHLVGSENPTNPMNQVQLNRLHHILSQLPARPVTFANSGGIFLGPDFHFNLARPGKALYGMHPVPGNEGILTPVMSLYARVTQVSSYQAGEMVGYDHTHTLTRDSRIATLAIGYADGYIRSLSNRGVVYFQNRPAPVLGRISMDYITVDITDIPEQWVYPGGWAEIINSQMPLNKIGDLAGTIARELMVHFGARHHRIYVGDLD